MTEIIFATLLDMKECCYYFKVFSNMIFEIDHSDYRVIYSKYIGCNYRPGVSLLLYI